MRARGLLRLPATSRLARTHLTAIIGGARATDGELERGQRSAWAIGPRVAAANKRQALLVVAEIAARAMKLKATHVFDALMEREARGSTGVGHGVAAPHARAPGLTEMGGVFVRLQSPIEFQAVDDQPVDLIFALPTSPGSGSNTCAPWPGWRACCAVAMSARRLQGQDHEETLPPGPAS